MINIYMKRLTRKDLPAYAKIQKTVNLARDSIVLITAIPTMRVSTI